MTKEIGNICFIVNYFIKNVNTNEVEEHTGPHLFSPVSIYIFLVDQLVWRYVQFAVGEGDTRVARSIMAPNVCPF